MGLDQLINDCKNNDTKAQEQLYRLFSSKLFAICLKYSRNYAEAEDNLQDGFLIIFDKIHQFNFKGSFEGWIKRIMTNTAIDFSRAQKNKNQFIELDEDRHEDKALQHLPDSHTEEEVLHLIKKLPAVTQQVFSMHIFKGYSHKEIAALLDIAESTSRWHVAEARKNLRLQAHKIY